MTFNLNYFLAAVGLLWLPMPFLARKDKAYANRVRSTSTTLPGLFQAWQNWADLIRSAVGTYALLELSIGLDGSGKDAALAGLIKAGILVLGVVIQTVRFTPGQTFLAPLFYLTGITLVFPGYREGAFAVLFGWIFVCGTRDPRFLLPTMGVALPISNYFLSGLSRAVLVNTAMIFLPILSGLLCQRRLVFVSRERRFNRAPIPKEPTADSARDKAPSQPQGKRRPESNLGLKSRPSSAK